MSGLVRIGRISAQIPSVYCYVIDNDLQEMDVDAVANAALGVLEEWLPGYVYGPTETRQYWICEYTDGTFGVFPEDKSGDGRRFVISVTVEELTT